MGWSTFDEDMRDDYERNPRYCQHCGARLEYYPPGSRCTNPDCPTRAGFPAGVCERCGGPLDEVGSVSGYRGGDAHDGRCPRSWRVTYRCRNCLHEQMEGGED